MIDTNLSLFHLTTYPFYTWTTGFKDNYVEEGNILRYWKAVTVAGTATAASYIPAYLWRLANDSTSKKKSFKCMLTVTSESRKTAKSSIHTETYVAMCK